MYPSVVSRKKHEVTKPDVSVIIPTYNRAALIADAVASCVAENAQDLRLQIIVVDDGSNDDTCSSLGPFLSRIEYVRLESNEGRNRARNNGLKRATGEFVKFLDSDDVLEPGGLVAECALARDSGADIVVSGWRCVEILPDRSSRLLARFEAPEMNPVIDSLLAGRAVPTGAALYSRALIGDMQWDERLRKLDDWDWFIRSALRARNIVRSPGIAYSWRQHPDQGVRTETMLLNAIEHHAILEKLEAALESELLLTSARRKRLAQYFYREMRVLCLHDKPRFDRGVRRIYELDPAFVPRDEERQWWMIALCRLFGVRLAVSLHSAVKKFARRGGWN